MQATTDESQSDTAAANTDDGHYIADVKVLLFNISTLATWNCLPPAVINCMYWVAM